MTNPLVLDALAVAFADSLDHLLRIESTVETIGVLEKALHESDPEWRDNIDPDARLLVEMAEDELHDLRARMPAVIKANQEYGARGKNSGQVHFYGGLFNSAEAVQAAIDSSGREDFEVVRRLSTDWHSV